MKKSVKKERGIVVEKPKPKQSNRVVLAHFMSKTRAGVEYHVSHTKGSGMLICTCPGFVHRSECSHVQRVLARNTNGIKMTLEREKMKIVGFDTDYRHRDGRSRKA